MDIPAHQYIERDTNCVKTEHLFFDKTIQTLYSGIREKAPLAFNLLISSRLSAVMGFLQYDIPIYRRYKTPFDLLTRMGVRCDEIHGPLKELNTYRKIFERQIQYWKYRPMLKNPEAVVSVADSKMLPGSFEHRHSLSIKNKLFEFDELIGRDKQDWLKAFDNGLYAVFRLTPDKYHYNHTPVSGQILDIYEINGCYHSCNPGALVRSVSPYSKNRRVVTIIDTDVRNGTGIGKVAMIEIVAMMIGRITQCYSGHKYDHPKAVQKGLFVEKGKPKSLFRPGSSTTVLVFEKDRFQFSADLLENCRRSDVLSRFSLGFGKPVVETEINVRETIGESIVWNR